MLIGWSFLFDYIAVCVVSMLLHRSIIEKTIYNAFDLQMNSFLVRESGSIGDDDHNNISNNSRYSSKRAKCLHVLIVIFPLDARLIKGFQIVFFLALQFVCAAMAIVID